MGDGSEHRKTSRWLILITLQQFLCIYHTSMKIKEKLFLDSHLGIRNYKHRIIQSGRIRTQRGCRPGGSKRPQKDKKHENFDKFKVRIKLHSQAIVHGQKFRIKIKRYHLNKRNESAFLASPLQSLVDNRKEYEKNGNNDETNQQSELISHVALADILRNKNIAEKSSNKFFMFFKLRNSIELEQQRPHPTLKDISCLGLGQLVNLLYNNKIISKPVYYRFLLHYSTNLEGKYLQMLREDPNEKINFKSCLFCLIDHRIMAKTLMDRLPEKYQMVTSALTFSNPTNQYLKEIYSIGEQQYFEKLRQFNHRHQRFWMPEPQAIRKKLQIQLNHEEQIEEIDRMNNFGRILRKKY